ncbi:DUF6421 family protein [Naasia sp. SYSU D00057]|uniref:DUF6421 family protein n=1 Tax=Naasia sp. SYSU D00057 TaxID=2817380 RepID=UPI001FEFD5B1|nr:DUF6421 family protein [Naasia sp. SYSU D00057]
MDATLTTNETRRTGSVDPALAPGWDRLASAVGGLRELQQRDGSLREDADRAEAARLVADLDAAVEELAPAFEHDADYLAAMRADLAAWAAAGFGVPDFTRAVAAFRPELQREDGLQHLVVFPMYTQNGSTERLFEAVLVEVVWPEFIAELETTAYSNALFVPIRFLAFTGGYDTNSAVLFPETVATGAVVPKFTWGAIFADREAARFRRVVNRASEITQLELPEDARRLLSDQELAEETFVLWDLIHDRTHMRGDLPFDPFMIKQRMPYFLYSLEELRCDLTAFRESVRLVRAEDTDEVTRDRARLAQYAILFDRLFRFPLTGSRVRNYDGLGGQLLFAWLHQRRVLHWTDTRLAFDWAEVPDAVVALSDAIDELYWASIDRPKTAHWLAAYDLVRSTLTPHPASQWARGLPDEVLSGPPKGMTDAVLDDEFPLSMFYEALGKKMGDVIASTSGITGRD